MLIIDESVQSVAYDAAETRGDMIVYYITKDENFSDTAECHEFNINSNKVAEQTTDFSNRISGFTGGSMKTVITTHAHFISTMKATLDTVPQNTDPDNDVWLSALSLGFSINVKLNTGLNLLLYIPVILINGPFGAENLQIIKRHKMSFHFIPPVAISIGGMSVTDVRKVDASSTEWLLSVEAAMAENVSRAVPSRSTTST